MKKLLTLLLVLALSVSALFTFSACGDDDVKEIELPAYDEIEAPEYSNLEIPSTFKMGMICLHDESSTYDKNFIDAARKAASELGLQNSQLIIKTGIAEKSVCYEEAEDLVDKGCSLIFADSFGHESYIAQSAREHSNVQYCHATGVTAHTQGLANFHNAFASIYEGRYLAGVAAGLKLKEMYGDKNGNVSNENAKVGYVGAYTYAEVVSGYTAWYLGVKSVVSNATMSVKFTGSWYDVTAEKEAAEALIAGGAKLISQHADSMGAPSACEAQNIPNVSYNGSTLQECPNTFIVSSRIDWTPYFKLIIYNTIKGIDIPTDYVGTIKTGSVVLTNLGGKASAKNTVDRLVSIREQLVSGSLKVFDCSKFTVNNGEAVSSKLVEGTEVVKTEGGVTYLDESKVMSAPYFDLRIDGITLLNEKF